MSFFSFFTGKSNNDPATIASFPVAEQPNIVDASLKIANNNNLEQISKPLTVSYATGWPIDVIYGYLHKNYESKGFEDAMIKSDFAFRDMNINIIRNKLLIVFREINLNYDVLNHDMENRIETCKAAGLLSTVAEMEKTMTIIRTHKAELQKLEEDFRNNANEASVPLQSYDCGFLRGIATLALSATSKTTAPVSIPGTNNSNNIKLTA